MRAGGTRGEGLRKRGWEEGLCLLFLGLHLGCLLMSIMYD